MIDCCVWIIIKVKLFSVKILFFFSWLKSVNIVKNFVFVTSQGVRNAVTGLKV